MNENLYLKPLSPLESCRLMLELSYRAEAKVIPFRGIPIEPMPKNKNSRKAKRITDAAAEKAKWDRFKAEQEQQRQAAIQLRARRDREAKEHKERDQEARQQARDARAQKKKSSKSTLTRYMPEDGRTGGHRDMYLKPLPPKVFEPVIGTPNAKGEIPVKLDAKTTVYVRPGKDVQETIAKYKKILNIK